MTIANTFVCNTTYFQQVVQCSHMTTCRSSHKLPRAHVFVHFIVARVTSHHVPMSSYISSSLVSQVTTCPCLRIFHRHSCHKSPRAHVFVYFIVTRVTSHHVPMSSYISSSLVSQVTTRPCLRTFHRHSCHKSPRAHVFVHFIVTRVTSHHAPMSSYISSSLVSSLSLDVVVSSSFKSRVFSTIGMSPSEWLEDLQGGKHCKLNWMLNIVV